MSSRFRLGSGPAEWRKNRARRTDGRTLSSGLLDRTRPARHPVLTGPVPPRKAQGAPRGGAAAPPWPPTGRSTASFRFDPSHHPVALAQRDKAVQAGESDA